MYNPFDIIKRFKCVYKNYLTVLLKIVMGNDKILVIPRKENLFTLTSVVIPRAIALALAHNPFSPLKIDGIEIDWEKDLINFKYNGKEVTLNGGITNGDFANVFIKGEYEWLKPTNSIVIDVGANIGDTSIFFALNDAKYIYSFEPYPYSYKLMSKNISENNLKNIKGFNGACGKEGNINVDPEYKNTEMDDLKEIPHGYTIKVYSLSDMIEIIKRDSIQNCDIILKCDCEGCEYDLILYAPSEILAMFSRIEIEYHYGYADLKKRLEELNFKVKYSKPVRNVNVYHKNKVGQLGMLYAVKNDFLKN